MLLFHEKFVAFVRNSAMHRKRKRSNLEFGKPPIQRRASPYLQNKQEKSLNDESLEMNVAISRKNCRVSTQFSDAQETETFKFGIRQTSNSKESLAIPAK